MTDNVRRGEIPSYRDTAAGDGQSSQKSEERKNTDPVLGVARICVYMNLENPIPDTIELEYHEEVWQQNIDFKHIPFRCRRCHTHGHLAKECPITREEEENREPPKKKREPDQEDFQEVRNKRKTNKEHPQKDRKGKQTNAVKPNSFAILQVEEDEEDQPMENQEDKGSNCSENSERNIAKRKAPSETPKQDKEKDEQTNRMETDHESSKEDLSQEEEVLENLLHEWNNLDERFIPEEQKKCTLKPFSNTNPN